MCVGGWFDIVEEITGCKWLSILSRHYCVERIKFDSEKEEIVFCKFLQNFLVTTHFPSQPNDGNWVSTNT